MVSDQADDNETRQSRPSLRARTPFTWAWAPSWPGRALRSSIFRKAPGVMASGASASAATGSGQHCTWSLLFITAPPVRFACLQCFEKSNSARG